MKLQRLHIKNFKSIVDLEIVEPNPFTVFVGPNGSGKSNIFEALEFAKLNLLLTETNRLLNSNQLLNNDIFRIPEKLTKEIENTFGGHNKFLNFNSESKVFDYHVSYEGNAGSSVTIDYGTDPVYFMGNLPMNPFVRDASVFNTFYYRFSHIFLTYGKSNPLSIFYEKLDIKASNLTDILIKIFSNIDKKEELCSWLELFIPEFKDIKIEKNLRNEDEFFIYEKYTNSPFPKHLISDGTFNILALLTAVYQSDEPQFLCIEEPENGLNPYVIRKLVDFFRAACEEKGHYIWLNTHSNSLVECLTPEEVIVVDKIGGETKIKQIKGMNLHGLNMAEVWLSGALGGGTPW